MEELLEQLADILETDEIKPQDEFESFEDWDSLSVLSIIAMVQSKYKIVLTATEVRNSKTAQGLFELIKNKG